MAITYCSLFEEPKDINLGTHISRNIYSELPISPLTKTFI